MGLVYLELKTLSQPHTTAAPSPTKLCSAPCSRNIQHHIPFRARAAGGAALTGHFNGSFWRSNYFMPIKINYFLIEII